MKLNLIKNKKFKFLIIFYNVLNFASAQIILPIPNSSNVDLDEMVITSDIEYQGSLSTGKYSVWYGCNHTQILKPIIYIEGIDLTPGNYEKSNEIILQNGSSFIQELMTDGFDIIQLDFDQNPQYVQRNAELLITLINNVNATIQANGSKHQIIILNDNIKLQII